MTFEQIEQSYAENISGTYRRFPVALVEGKGAIAKDVDGKEYIDFTSGIGVNSLGYSYDPWVEAVTKQTAMLNHTSNLYYTLPQEEVAKKLCARSGAKKVFFCNSGAEANEGAIKTARKWGIENKGKNAWQIVGLESAFHGRTLGALAATPQAGIQDPFGPMMDGFSFVPAEDIGALKAVICENTCAVIMELVQGESGVTNLSVEYVQAVSALCKEKNILLIIDEVQTGIGRTGTLFCFEQFGITPDIVTLAKGLGSGLPVGATLYFEKTEKVLVPGNHGTTFGGNPIVMAGANVVLETIDIAFLKEVQKKSEIFRNALSRMPHIKQVTGLGMMIGIELSGVAVGDVVSKGMENGLLTLTAHERLRLLPPLNIPEDQIQKGLIILEKTLQEV